MKYAIIDNNTKEFYPDPMYEDRKKAQDKINYLQGYEAKNNMEIKNWAIEKLNKERFTQHEKEWKRYVSMID